VAPWRRVLRPRTLIYSAVWAAIGLVMLAMLTTRDRVALTVLHDRNPLFTELSAGDIRNGYTVKVLNMLAEPRTFRISIEGLEGATLSIAGAVALDGRVAEVTAPPDAVRSLRALVTAPADGARRDFEFVLEEVRADGAAAETGRSEAVFHGPARR
jgi:polyferredoxin